VNIKDKIYEIRGEYVMLDSDLAKLYQCKNGTKEINQAVKRNITRFPRDFCFQLTKEEYENILNSQNVSLELDMSLKSQNVTSSRNHGGVRKLPYVFTEQGVAMLASVLKTDVAAVVSVQIMRTFVMLKNMFLII